MSEGLEPFTADDADYVREIAAKAERGFYSVNPKWFLEHAIKIGATVAQMQELRESHARLLVALKDCADWIEAGKEQAITPSVKGVRTLAEGVKLLDRCRAAIAAAPAE